MKTVIIELVDYLKNPTLEKDQNKEISYRLKKFVQILGISFATTFALGFILTLIEGTGWLETGKHSIEDTLKNSNTLTLFVLAAIIAPAIEELLFRAPLTLFKKAKTFKIAFYLITFLFGYIHLINYDITLNILLFSPILIAPQLFIGWYLGFIRVRFGLIWSIALHAAYNGILVSLFILGKNAIS